MGAGPSENGAEETRQERREERQQCQRRRVAKHGGSLKRVYPDAVRKRLKQGKKPGQE